MTMDITTVTVWTWISVNTGYILASTSPFFLVPHEDTWTNSQAYCSNHSGRLITFGSQSKYDHAVTMDIRYHNSAIFSSNEVYIGLSTTSTDCTNYTWSSGKALDWSKWDLSNNQPKSCSTRHFVKMNVKGLFRTSGGLSKRKAVCEYVTPVSPSASSSMTTTKTTTSTSGMTTTDVTMTTTKTTGTTTTDVITANTSCDCCIRNRTNVTQLSHAELQDVMTQLRTELSVSKNNTSSYRRKRISVYESRPSSMVMGGVACVIIAVPIGWIVVPDLITLCVFLWKRVNKRNVPRA